ncbi:MAG: TRAP transporter small permease [Geminicoccaceae bacterium]
MPRASPGLTPAPAAMRVLLSRLYAACGALAALFLAAIAVLVLTSITSRLLGYSVPGLTAYAGYCMAASSFLALAYTFVHGGHIRVGVLLQHVDGWRRRAAELWCLAVGAFLAAYLAWYSVKMVRVSIRIGDISQAPDATPLWIPQLGMAFGAAVLAIALVDRLIAVARGAPIEADRQLE